METYKPTPTQAENDLATRGLMVVNKADDDSPSDPYAPAWAQTLPANETAPTLSGPSPPVVGATLFCKTGEWNGGGITLTYQWLRATAPIFNAVLSSYTVVTADKTNALSCRVTATNTKGSTNVTTAATAVVP